ncbi:bifunctional diguanylate cyclase/phosphodiesterase [Anaerorhabdus furcosa]|uniref:EAL domain, c-di-GMP-specific phosphodiesterase class I (Or its enzymatically inactive variant) n=1 Tax=Anaerorhabdus furcosa TaxID=118967 RepID=A0A1T4LKW9_9FIRM|nr:EAL domain-containing protein [Anaerorhabdus furcosa]SJZ55392.1 EAL domain, c-di-GMP-specific phosphodiesterase class I (or its enzymatically inactive variant) [Anaerorhabdus furcosa]
MLNLQLLFESKQQFQIELDKININTDSPCLVRVYACNKEENEIADVVNDIESILSKSKIIGCSTSGVIYKGKQYEDHILVIIEQFRETDVITGLVEYTNKTPREVVLEMKEILGSVKGKAMHIFSGAQWIEITECVELINQILPDLKLTGGIAGGEIGHDKIPFVFESSKIRKEGIVFAAYINDDMNIFCDANISHEPISSVYSIDSVDGCYLKSIEKTPATDWCFEQFGIEKLEEYRFWQQIVENDELTKFPLILEGHHGVSRFLHYDSTKGKMSLYQMKLPENTKFRIGYVSPTRCVKECHDICVRIAKEPIESLFCYTCVFRKLYLENCAEWELKPFASANISGAFMLGEIGWNVDRNEVFNGSCVYFGISEEESYITPDFSVFNDLYRVHTDDDKLVNFVLKKQSLAMTHENQLLMDKLLDQQEKSKQQLFQDSITGLGNTLKYTNDKKEMHFNKMCLIQIENFNLLVSRLGQEGYHELLKDATRKLHHYLVCLEDAEKFNYYILNDSTLFIAAGSMVTKELFIKHIDYIYDHFQTMHFDAVNEVLINRFIIVNADKNLLETGILALKECQSLQTHYVDYNEIDENRGNSLEKEEEILNVLNYAIDTDNIIPYFQGIHDNKHQCINKFEALMRIVDEDGNVYVPSQFMDIAKKYHLYSKLSISMIEKVLTLFDGSNFEVSINLSAYDISYRSVNEFILQKLSKMKDCKNFVFEILEDESFKDMEVLRKFLKEVRKFGVKIAIDDFGIGYSNFMAIAQMAPDYIKIDGSIVKNIQRDELCKKVLENIVFLGKQLNVEIIAEFVEDLIIQEEVIKHKIQYSQGYCFSKPVPFAHLTLS